MNWRIEQQDDVFALDTPDGAAMFILDRASALALGCALTQAGLGELNDGAIGLIRCTEFVFVPYCQDCPTRGVHIVKSSKTSKSSNHQISGQNHTLQGLVIRVMFDTRLGDLVLAMVERVLGLAVLQLDDLN